MKLKVTLALMVLTLALAATANAGVHVTIYSTFSCCSGAGTPYSNPVGSFWAPDIMFATNTGYNWHPFGLSDFAAEIDFGAYIPSPGSYTFTLNSDDGSQLWSGGSMVVDNGGAHSPNIVFGSGTFLNGPNSFQLYFFECCGGPSGVDLTLPAGVSYTPEPSTLAMLGTGILGIAGAFRRRIGL